MKQGRFLGGLLLILLTFQSIVLSWDDTPSCFKDLEVNFFDPTLVIQGLNLHQGYVDYQNRWIPINNELKHRSQDIPNMIRQRASRMSPNPLEYPFQADVATKLLWETLLEVFTAALNDYEIYDQGAIRDMFNYISRRQEYKLKACLGNIEVK